MGPLEGVGLAAAGALAGAVNALAGGGSLLTFPALVAAGHTTLAANVTNTVALWPGYIGGVVGFRPELVGQAARVRHLSAIAVVGAVAGSVLLLALPDRAFDLVVPALVLLATALLAVQPRVARWLQVRRAAAVADGRGPVGAAAARPGSLDAVVLVGAAYGAYFGGGLGVVLLAALGLLVDEPLTRLNATKAVLSLVINSVALVAFVAFAPVDWAAVAVMAPASTVGGTAGARLARVLSPTVLRTAVVALGTVAGVVLIVR